MDREDIILIKILNAAKEGTLSKRSWRKYDCASPDEMQTFIENLLSAKAISQHTQPPSVARDGHGRELIAWENDPYYSITPEGAEALEGLEQLNS